MSLALHNLTDEALVELLKEDNEDAFKEIFARYRVRLFMEAYNKLNDNADAQDIVQIVFIRFWQKRSSIPLLGISYPLKYYLLKAIRYECIDVIRLRAYNEKQQAQYAYFHPSITFNNAIENEELGRQLNSAINDIAPASRTAFQMMYVEHKTLKEIANHMGISVFTVKNHIVNALKKLRKNLKKVK